MDGYIVDIENDELLSPIVVIATIALLGVFGLGFLYRAALFVL
ncbi:hypothetical protein [Halopenitus persicus]|uniref:Uncharacterized protein n=1 Tax=Halopenitus persicus TaxID=1048396 RepID=A0A1H3EBS0_9EURY|nr:hypothetical protein [Halopenitus persicus]SDX76183.1 hypothetical protein SAMN05216564_101370 [Halopenitus persicus]